MILNFFWTRLKNPKTYKRKTTGDIVNYSPKDSILVSPNIFEFPPCLLTKVKKVAPLFNFLLQSKPAKPKVEKSGLDM